jgi:RimJ/RimL family protein N-acetyltransferase
MKQYCCLPREQFAHGHYRVVAVQPIHIDAIRRWRNEQRTVLRQSAMLTVDEQERYYAAHVWPEMNRPEPSQVLFSLFLDERFIAYGGLMHIAWEHKRAEISFLADPVRAADEDTYAADFYNFLILMREIGFGELGLHRLFTETYDIRPRHIAVLEQCGFVREGALREHVIIDGRAVDSVMHGSLSSDGE